MTAFGAFTFILNTHLPYVHLAGPWPHGESWLHEAISDTYIPLLRTLYDLRDEGLRYHLTISLSPVLCEQLSDPEVLQHFDQFLEERIQAAQDDMLRFRLREPVIVPRDVYAAPRDVYAAPRDVRVGQPLPGGDAHLFYLASWYRDWYQSIRTTFNERFRRDLIGAFRQLQDDGLLEIFTSAATHAYLPLLGYDSSIRAQLDAAVTSYKRFFHRQPHGIWLPECAYRPGLESMLASRGLRVFVAEPHMISGGQPLGIADGDVIGPRSQIRQHFGLLPVAPSLPARSATTYRAYELASATDHGVASGVVVVGRNHSTGHQVCSAQWGYPGDFDYREFDRRAGSSGLRYWRVTSHRLDLEQKDYWHPDWAEYKLAQHAEHFAHQVGDLLRDYQHGSGGAYGLIAAAFDTTLFGHRWFEGVDWLGQVLRHLSQSPHVDLTRLADYAQDHTSRTRLHLYEGSWGVGGHHFICDNGDTRWMWELIHAAEARMQALADRFSHPDADTEFVLQQAARELLLLQSSDWLSLVTTEQSRQYACQRFRAHHEQFERLASSLDQDQPDRAYAAGLWEKDKLFPDMDYRWFRSEGR